MCQAFLERGRGGEEIGGPARARATADAFDRSGNRDCGNNLAVGVADRHGNACHPGGALGDALRPSLLSDIGEGALGEDTVVEEGGPDAVGGPGGLAVVSDDAALGQAVDAVIAAQPEVADKIRDGKVQAAGALIGAVMKAMRGQADAARVRELILQRLA